MSPYVGGSYTYRIRHDLCNLCHRRMPSACCINCSASMHFIRYKVCGGAFDIKRSPLGCYAPSGLTLYIIIYVPSRHDLSNTYIIIRITGHPSSFDDSGVQETFVSWSV